MFTGIRRYLVATAAALLITAACSALASDPPVDLVSAAKGGAVEVRVCDGALKDAEIRSDDHSGGAKPPRSSPGAGAKVTASVADKVQRRIARHASVLRNA